MQVGGILETALYVEDPVVSAAFFGRIFGFRVLSESDRLIALDVAGRSVLLLFRKGATTEPFVFAGGVVPAHAGSPPTHFAFSIRADDVSAWKDRLEAEGVAVESVVDWSPEAKSIYFRDPDGNLAELITPGFWMLDAPVG